MNSLSAEGRKLVLSEEKSTAEKDEKNVCNECKNYLEKHGCIAQNTDAIYAKIVGMRKTYSCVKKSVTTVIPADTRGRRKAAPVWRADAEAYNTSDL